MTPSGLQPPTRSLTTTTGTSEDEIMNQDEVSSSGAITDHDNTKPISSITIAITEKRLTATTGAKLASQQPQQPQQQQHLPPPIIRPPDGWTRCHAYLQRKSRFCRQEILKGCKYCGNHAYINNNHTTTTGTTTSCSSINLSTAKKRKHDNDSVSFVVDDNDNICNDNTKLTNNKKRKRIPCPIDPTHTIFEDVVDKHIMKCPKAIQRQNQQKQIYYQCNINKGGYGKTTSRRSNDYCKDPLPGTTIAATTTTSNQSQFDSVQQHQQQEEEDDDDESKKSLLSRLEYAKLVALRILYVHQKIFRLHSGNQKNDNDNNNKNNSNRAITDNTLEDIENALPLHDLSQYELEQHGLSNELEYHRIKSGGIRHIHQQASIVGHLRRIGCINNNNNTAATTQKKTIAVGDYYNSHNNSKNNNNNDINSNNNNNSMTTTIVEMGAGRGMTGLVVAGVVAAAASASSSSSSGDEDCAGNKNDDETKEPLILSMRRTRLVMIERDASRSRADKVLRKALKFGKNHDPSSNSNDDKGNDKKNDNYFQLHTLQWDRIQCDLSHVNMNSVLSLCCPRHQASSSSCNNKNRRNTEELVIQKVDENTSANNGDMGMVNDNVIVIAKHCCGAGTDLALKSLESMRERVTACIMTTCCHGVCNWDDYVGRDHLIEIMVSNSTDDKNNDNIPLLSSFGSLEFEFLRLWSSGSVRAPKMNNNADDSTQCKNDNSYAGTKKSNENDSVANPEEDDEDDHANSNIVPSTGSTSNTPSGLHSDNVVTVSQVVEALQVKCGALGLGRACQRLIDYGRKEYMRTVLFASNQENIATTNVDEKDVSSVELLYYVPIAVTPQNAMLIAHRRKKKKHP